MKFIHSSTRRSFFSGFSLIELLTVISVIGVMTSIVAPSFGSINGAAQTAVQQDNAQNIVSMFKAGDAAQVAWTTTSRDAAVADVIAGRPAPAKSVFAGKTFNVPHLSAQDIQAAYRYIGLDSQHQLFFDKNGSQAAQ